MALLRPPADCTSSASTSGRCITPVASKAADIGLPPLHRRLRHALPPTFSVPRVGRNCRKQHLLKASVAEVGVAVPADGPLRGNQANGSSEPESAVHPVELPADLRNMVCPHA